MARSQGKEKPKARKASIKIRIFRLLFDLMLCFLALTVVPTTIYRAINPPTTPLMWIRWAENGFKTDSPRALRQWTPLNKISPHLVRAVLAAEDQKFFQHGGFDWDAAEAALVHNMKSEKKIGASTISMQAARNVFLWQNRNWFRKALEAYFTFLMETFWSKDRILEVYLNVIEWGDGVFGCGPAAQAYFKRPAAKLSPYESAWMAAILPNPRKWSIDNPPKNVEVRQARILNSMGKVRTPAKS